MSLVAHRFFCHIVSFAYEHVCDTDPQRVFPHDRQNVRPGIKSHVRCLCYLQELVRYHRCLRKPDHEAFGAFITPHLDAAYTLARWIVTDEHDAADVLQDACLKALVGFASYRGGNGRSWVLAIVRNTAYNFLRDRRHGRFVPLDDGAVAELPDQEMDPQERLVREADVVTLQRVIESLPAEYREAIVLKEFQELSYKEIAVIQCVPIGTIMSRLARARTMLRDRMTKLEERA